MNGPVLDAGVLELLQRRVMVSVASRSSEQVPSVVRCVGFRLFEGTQRLAVFVRTRYSERVLADVRATGLAAVVFSEPSTHRTVQLKGTDATVGPLEEGDWPTIGAHSEAAVAELGPLGYPETWVRTVFEATPAQVQAIRFTISSAFGQTPGPRAGAPLAGAQP
ncbi:MAG TPA: pyridoxamine 5'-phosphate oxidase family protein [Burkholderiaceae bacterium]|nr:pyridoxamine 5'-phosphate oxidase family protein [Burkholderiaceae bacterium]